MATRGVRWYLPTRDRDVVGSLLELGEYHEDASFCSCCSFGSGQRGRFQRAGCDLRFHGVLDRSQPTDELSIFEITGTGARSRAPVPLRSAASCFGAARDYSNLTADR